MVAFVVEARRKYHPAKRSRLRPFRVPRRFPASSRRPIRIKLLGTRREEAKSSLMVRKRNFRSNLLTPYVPAAVCVSTRNLAFFSIFAREACEHITDLLYSVKNVEAKQILVNFFKSWLPF